VITDSQVIPFSAELFYTLFVCVLVPTYWRHYGVANFLWFSDLALLIGLAAMWLESPLLASMQAVSVLLLEVVWIIDFLVRLTTGKQVIGIAEYMFKSDEPLFLRGLSLFHLVLPFFLVWLVYALGYDSRAWILQIFLFWAVMLICFFFTKPSDNINWAHACRPDLHLPAHALFPRRGHAKTICELNKLSGRATHCSGS
jgi:hypothetical protein